MCFSKSILGVIHKKMRWIYCKWQNGTIPFCPQRCFNALNCLRLAAEYQPTKYDDVINKVTLWLWKLSDFSARHTVWDRGWWYHVSPYSSHCSGHCCNIRNNKMYNHSRYNDKWQVEIANITYLVLCCLFNTLLSIVYIYICLMNKQTIQRSFGYWKTIATVFLVCLAKIVTIRYRMSSLSSFKVTQVGVLSTNWHATIPYSV